MFGGGTQRSPGQASRVRSQFLDMSLDHDSGELPAELWQGRMPATRWPNSTCRSSRAMMTGFDAESVALLESYLDRRFPAWRQDAQADAATGQRRPTASGKMTNEEAYQILGLQPGASSAKSGARIAA